MSGTIPDIVVPDAHPRLSQTRPVSAVAVPAAPARLDTGPLLPAGRPSVAPVAAAARAVPQAIVAEASAEAASGSPPGRTPARRTRVPWFERAAHAAEEAQGGDGGRAPGQAGCVSGG